MSVGHVLLGLLSQGPAHGYDLKRDYDGRFPGAKPLAYGQVYATLARLQRDDLVEVAETTRDGGPDKITYALTERGRDELQTWLSTTEPTSGYLADDLVRKTITALHLGADAAGFLRDQRKTYADQLRELVAEQRAATEIGARIAIDHTIFHVDADLKWLETAAARVAAEGERR